MRIGLTWRWIVSNLCEGRKMACNSDRCSHFTDKNSAHSFLKERGAVLVMFVCFIPLLFLLGTVLGSVATARMSARQLQDAADDAAISAAAALNSGVDGWRSAKRVAIASISSKRLYQAHGDTGIDMDQNCAVGADVQFDILEEDPALSRCAGTVGAFTVTIERGTYWMTSSGFQFKSLEGLAGKSSITVEGGAMAPLFYGIPVHLLANSVRVTIQRAAHGLIGKDLTGLMNGVQVPSITRQATAASHSQMSYLAAPFAIPACALMAELDNSPTSTKVYSSDRYVAANQCQREVLITESNRWTTYGIDAAHPPYFDATDRIEGFARYRSYQTNPDIVYHPAHTAALASAPNPRAVPVYGSLGIFAAPGGSVSKSSVTDVLNNMSGQTVSLGDVFRPIDDPLQLNPAALSNLRDALRDLIKGNRYDADENAFKGTTVGALFSGDEAPAKPRTPSSLTTSGVEYPEYRVGSSPPVAMVNQVIVTESDGSAIDPAKWTNPLCTDFNDRADGLVDGVDSTPGSVIIPNSDLSPAVENVVIPLIAPSLDPSGGNAVDSPDFSAYCDFSSQYNGTEQESAPPSAATRPVVVGFVKASMFDFRVTSFGALTPQNSPNPTIDPGPQYLKTAMPATANFQSSAIARVQSHSQWKAKIDACMADECRYFKKTTTTPPPPPGKYYLQVKEAGVDKYVGNDGLWADPTCTTLNCLEGIHICRTCANIGNCAAECKALAPPEPTAGTPPVSTAPAAPADYWDQGPPPCYVGTPALADPAAYAILYDTYSNCLVSACDTTNYCPSPIAGHGFCNASSVCFLPPPAACQALLIDSSGANAQQFPVSSTQSYCLPIPKVATQLTTGETESPGCLDVSGGGVGDYSKPECWLAPAPLRPQFGCGGIRVRLSCAQDSLVYPTTSSRQRTPRLVR